MKTAARNTARRAPRGSAPKEIPSSLTIGQKRIPVSNLDKVLYPEAGFTKGQVIDYYLRVAPVLLPHLKRRPLTLKRYPNGVDAPFFYEKRCPAHRPDWVTTGKVWSEGNNDYINYCLVEDRATIAWLANIACLEMHTLLAKMPNVGEPTSMVFDLDPGPPANILDSIRVGLQMRDVLAKLGLKAFAKTSGSKGLHLWVPLNMPTTFERTKHFSHAMALLFEREHPKQVLSVMRKDLRKGKVFVDWSQNDEHKTTACAYTMRARSQPTVSTPVTWEELEAALKAREPDRVSFKTNQVLDRVQMHGDLFAPVLKLKQRLPDSM
ncbi:MAG TPA: non-homologous end-joining DNA ligase [Tepidisphaeraceae bacterium]|nr:non-homologous end-joining DNA ligase [Tepidisphaeraceae bacterium]